MDKNTQPESKDKKQILLRISEKLWRDLSQWAEDDFRSINGQIEYLLTESVKKRKRGSKPPSDEASDSSEQ